MDCDDTLQRTNCIRNCVPKQRISSLVAEPDSVPIPQFPSLSSISSTAIASPLMATFPFDYWEEEIIEIESLIPAIASGSSAEIEEAFDSPDIPNDNSSAAAVSAVAEAGSSQAQEIIEIDSLISAISSGSSAEIEGAFDSPDIPNDNNSAAESISTAAEAAAAAAEAGPSQVQNVCPIATAATTSYTNSTLELNDDNNDNNDNNNNDNNNNNNNNNDNNNNDDEVAIAEITIANHSSAQNVISLDESPSSDAYVVDESDDECQFLFERPSTITTGSGRAATNPNGEIEVILIDDDNNNEQDNIDRNESNTRRESEQASEVAAAAAAAAADDSLVVIDLSHHSRRQISDETAIGTGPSQSAASIGGYNALLLQSPLPQPLPPPPSFQDSAALEASWQIARSYWSMQSGATHSSSSPLSATNAPPPSCVCHTEPCTLMSRCFCGGLRSCALQQPQPQPQQNQQQSQLRQQQTTSTTYLSTGASNGSGEPATSLSGATPASLEQMTATWRADVCSSLRKLSKAAWHTESNRKRKIESSQVGLAGKASSSSSSSSSSAKKAFLANFAEQCILSLVPLLELPPASKLNLSGGSELTTSSDQQQQQQQQDPVPVPAQVVAGFICTICLASSIDTTRSKNHKSDTRFFSTNCGHIFCETCLPNLWGSNTTALRNQCSVCRKRLNKKQVHRIFQA